MPLVSLVSLLEQAQKEGYGVGYFESWNLESLQGVLAAAEETGAPVIAGFNGGFLNSPARRQPESLAYYACVRSALDRSSVPVSFLLNETDNMEQIKEGVKLGFNAVMPESEGLALDDYRGFVKEVIGLARSHGVSVEAQVGCLASGAADHNGHCELTDPDTASAFVEDTGVDALAVSVGNVHILTEGKADLNLDVLRKIRDRVRVPLVLHGGTSIPLELNKELIALGVVKFNYGTVLKQAYLEAVKEKLALYEPPMSPHPFLGMGGAEDIMAAGRDAVRLKVKEIIATLRPNCR